MKATTPYRRLQERVQELEEISKVHQKQNGELQVKLNEKDKKIQELTDRLEATTEEIEHMRVEISKKDKQIEELEGELIEESYLSPRKRMVRVCFKSVKKAKKSESLLEKTKRRKQLEPNAEKSEVEKSEDEGDGMTKYIVIAAALAIAGVFIAKKYIAK